MGAFLSQHSFARSLRRPLSVMPLFTAIPLIIGACSKNHNLDSLQVIRTLGEDKGHVLIDTEAQAEELEPTTRYIFVLDKSGSNQKNVVLNADGSIFVPITITKELATDPTGQKRYAPIAELVKTFPTNSASTYFALVNFSDFGQIAKNLTNSRDDFLESIQSEWETLQDQGATNYLSALAQVESLIQKDITDAVAKKDARFRSSYIICFISDGFPILKLYPDSNPPKVETQTPTEILNGVRTIKAFEASRYVDSVTLHTVYYKVPGNEDPKAKELLRNMASAGLGRFFDAGATFDLKFLTAHKNQIRYDLAEVFVRNSSALWLDGAYVADADRDGLSDKTEINLGSNPEMSDTDGNGVSDAVELSAFGKVMSGKSFTSSTAGLPGLCSTLAYTGGALGISVTFLDRDKDRLNDCEELILGSLIDDFDQNQSLIPDGLEFLMGLPFKSSNQAHEDPDFDRQSNILEILQNSPHFYSNSNYINLKPTTYHRRSIRLGDDSPGIQIEVDDLPRLDPNDFIEVFVMRGAKSTVSDTRLESAEKGFAGSNSIHIRIPDEEAAGVWR